VRARSEREDEEELEGNFERPFVGGVEINRMQQFYIYESQIYTIGSRIRFRAKIERPFAMKNRRNPSFLFLERLTVSARAFDESRRYYTA